MCAKIDEKVVAYATTKFIDINYLKEIINGNKLNFITYTKYIIIYIIVYF